MKGNLLRKAWINLDSYELRLVLDRHVGGSGQCDPSENPNKLYLPRAGSSCQIALIFDGNKIAAIEPGPAWNDAVWEQVSDDIEKSILAGPLRVGRDYSFSSFEVSGYWWGARSGVQVLPPPDYAPRANMEIAEHPFILEFPIQASDLWQVTNHRRMREHRKVTLLLNVLLAGQTSLPPRRSEHFWALVRRDDGERIEWLRKLHQLLFWWSRRHRGASRADPEIKWVQRFFFAKLYEPVIDEPSPPAGDQLEELEPEEYYTTVGHDGKGLRVPADLDQSICLYQNLSATNRAKFDRATFWMGVASGQWSVSVSSSFASLVSAVESLTDRGTTHRVYCKECERVREHEEPGATETFRAFFDNYAPGAALRARRSKMYALRSDILHGSSLMHLDQDLRFGWDPPEWNERELHRELWGLTRVALRNWLRNPPAP
jgi:hypothetical protein